MSEMTVPVPADAFRDVEAALLEDNPFTWTTDAHDGLVQAYNESVGNYLRCWLAETPPVDWWSVRQFKRFVLTHVRIIAWELLKAGVSKPTSQEVYACARAVMKAAKNKYCRDLPRCGTAPSAKASGVFRGPICPPLTDDDASTSPAAEGRDTVARKSGQRR